MVSTFNSTHLNMRTVTLGVEQQRNVQPKGSLRWPGQCYTHSLSERHYILLYCISIFNIQLENSRMIQARKIFPWSLILLIRTADLSYLLNWAGEKRYKFNALGFRSYIVYPRARFCIPEGQCGRFIALKRIVNLEFHFICAFEWFFFVCPNALYRFCLVRLFFLAIYDWTMYILVLYRTRVLSHATFIVYQYIFLFDISLSCCHVTLLCLLFVAVKTWYQQYILDGVA